MGTAATAGLSSRGSFSALDARALGAGSATDRMTKAAEETARNTKLIYDEMRLGGAAFE